MRGLLCKHWAGAIPMAAINCSKWLRLFYPFTAPVDFVLQAGYLRLGDGDQTALDGKQVQGDLAWTVGRHVGLSGWARWRDFAVASVTPAGGAKARLKWDAHELHILLAADDIATVAAQNAGIRFASWAAKYRFNGFRWRANLQLEERYFTDTNRIDNARGTLYYRPIVLPSWEFGAEIEHAASLRRALAYYAPEAYLAMRARVNYQWMFAPDSYLGLASGLGVSRDDLYTTRGSVVVRAHGAYRWKSTLQGEIAMYVSNTVGYQSSGGEITLTWRP